MSAEVTRTQGELIAELVHALRPDWHVSGILPALLQVRDRDPFQVALAAIRAANRAANLTPAIIPLPGPHWLPEPGPKPAGWTPADLRPCNTCGRVHDPTDNGQCPPRNRGAYKTGAEQARLALLEAKTKERHQESNAAHTPSLAPSPHVHPDATTKEHQ